MSDLGVLEEEKIKTKLELSNACLGVEVCASMTQSLRSKSWEIWYYENFNEISYQSFTDH